MHSSPLADPYEERIPCHSMPYRPATFFTHSLTHSSFFSPPLIHTPPTCDRCPHLTFPGDGASLLNLLGCVCDFVDHTIPPSKSHLSNPTYHPHLVRVGNIIIIVHPFGCQQSCSPPSIYLLSIYSNSPQSSRAPTREHSKRPSNIGL